MPRLLLFLLLSVALHASAVMLLHEVPAKPVAPMPARGATVPLVQLTLLAPPLPKPVIRQSEPVAVLAKPPAPTARPTQVMQSVSQLAPAKPRVCQGCAQAVVKPQQLAVKATRPSMSVPSTTPRPVEVPAVAVPTVPPVEVFSQQPTFAQQPQPPYYPPLARRRNQQGVVLLEVRLDAQGGQRELKLLRSSGVSSLDQAALNAVAAWRFRPETRNGQAVPSRVQIPVEFALLASR